MNTLYWCVGQLGKICGGKFIKILEILVTKKKTES